MIYTSYFANWRNFPKDSIVIGITRYPPKGAKNLIELAPSRELLWQYKNKIINEEIFTTRYLRELKENVNKEKLVQFLRDQSNDVVLCCYEKKGDFCHRQIVRDWLKNDIEIVEL